MKSSRRNFLAGAAALGFGSPFSQVAGQEKRRAPLRVAVIGHTGRGDYGHGLDTLWKPIAGFEVVAVADPVAEGRTKAAKRLELDPDHAFADYEEMLARVSPDLVSVAPRHVDQHSAMAIAAANAGARGIYIEKPFVRDLGEADEVFEACRASGTRLAIAHRNRYHPVLPVVRELVEEGEIGPLLEIRCRGKEDRRGGCLDLWVLGSHLLNLAHYFSGTPTACSATIFDGDRPVEPDDIVDGSEGVGPLGGNRVHARFETASGVPVFFDSIQDRGTREAGFGLQLIGTEGLIDLRADREPLAHLKKGSPFPPSAEGQPWIPVTSGGIGVAEPAGEIRALVGGHRAAVLDLRDAIEEDRPALCNANEGRTVVAMTMAVFASHRSGGKRVAFPLAENRNPFVDWR